MPDGRVGRVEEPGPRVGPEGGQPRAAWVAGVRARNVPGMSRIASGRDPDHYAMTGSSPAS